MLKNKVIPLFVVILLGVLSFSPVNAQSTELSEWKNTMQYPQSISSHQSLSYQGSIFVFGGGYNDTYTKDIFRAEISNNGEINNWVKAGELPTPLIWHSIVRKDNYIFLIGGAISSGNSVITTNKVYIATISVDKSISSWKEISSLPVGLGRGNALIFNDNLYYLGGVTKNLPNQNEGVNSTVYSAQINLTDQTLNSWSSKTGLPQALAEFAIFQNENIIFVAGGMRANSQPSNVTYRGEINPSGDLTWSISQNTPEGLRRPAYAQIGNNLFLIGGYNGSSFVSNIYHSTINNSVIDNWTPLTNQIPSVSCCNTAEIVGNYIYLIGRHDGVSYSPDVIFSKLLLKKIFPVLKQYDPKWKDVTYDSADVWSPGKSTIERYGCAVTSAAMILQNYGHSVTPESLNSWLIENDGYVGDGLLNWSAVTKWAKESHESNSDAKKLEYKRYAFTTEKLDEELTATRPAILKLKNNENGGTHFVVVTNKDQSVYKMSDPATENEDLSFYPSDRYNRINSFVPSNTDLSYLYAYLSPTHNLKVLSPSGSELDGIDEEATYEDQVEHTVLKNKQLTTFEWAKPVTGKYTLKVSGNGNYSLETRYYDSQANLEKKQLEGKSTNGTTDTYYLTIGTQTTLKKVDFAYLKELITNGYSGNKIKTKGVYQALYSTVLAAEKASQKQNTKLSKVLLDVMVIEIKLSRKYILAETSTELINTIQILKDSL